MRLLIDRVGMDNVEGNSDAPIHCIDWDLLYHKHLEDLWNEVTRGDAAHLGLGISHI